MVGHRQSLGPSWAGTRVCVLASAQVNLLVASADAQNWLSCGRLWGFRRPHSPHWRAVCSPHPALLISVPLGEQAALQANTSALRAWLGIYSWDSPVPRITLQTTGP